MFCQKKKLIIEKEMCDKGDKYITTNMCATAPRYCTAALSNVD